MLLLVGMVEGLLAQLQQRPLDTLQLDQRVVHQLILAAAILDYVIAGLCHVAAAILDVDDVITGLAPMMMVVAIAAILDDVIAAGLGQVMSAAAILDGDDVILLFSIKSVVVALLGKEEKEKHKWL